MPKANASSPATPRKARSAKKTAPTTEEIQVRAYEIYLDRNGTPGNPLEDWVRAEQELTAHYGPRPKASRTPRAAKHQAA